jgi:hypothetical protein
VSSPKPANVPQSLLEARLEDERMQEILLLLDHLLKREEVTVKLILNCLYDIGSVRLVNQKLPGRPLNGMAKSILRLSKPVFRFYALRRLQRQGPPLIAKWLHRKVSFKPPAPTPPKPPISVKAKTTDVALSKIEVIQPLEVQRLQTQVRYLQGVSLGAIAALLGGFVWVGYSLQWEFSQLTPPPRSVRVENR